MLTDGCNLNRSPDRWRARFEARKLNCEVNHELSQIYRILQGHGWEYNRQLKLRPNIVQCLVNLNRVEPRLRLQQCRERGAVTNKEAVQRLRLTRPCQPYFFSSSQPFWAGTDTVLDVNLKFIGHTRIR